MDIQDSFTLNPLSAQYSWTLEMVNSQCYGYVPALPLGLTAHLPFSARHCWWGGQVTYAVSTFLDLPLLGSSHCAQAMAYRLWVPLMVLFHISLVLIWDFPCPLSTVHNQSLSQNGLMVRP